MATLGTVKFHVLSLLDSVASVTANMHHYQSQRKLIVGTRNAHYKSLEYKGIEKMITFKFFRFRFVVYLPHRVNKLVTDIILNITSQEYLIFTLLQIGSRLFELFSKEVRVNKQPGMPLKRALDNN